MYLGFACLTITCAYLGAKATEFSILGGLESTCFSFFAFFSFFGSASDCCTIVLAFLGLVFGGSRGVSSDYGGWTEVG